MDALSVVSDVAEGVTLQVRQNNAPRPEDFDQFLPWACRQLQVDVHPIIINITTKTQKHEASKSSAKIVRSKHKKSISAISTIVESSMSFVSLGSTTNIQSDNHVKIYTLYDGSGHLMQLKFDKNKTVPKQLFTVIGLFIHLLTHLNSITINQGIQKPCLYELNKLISQSNITDVCLDGTCINDGNYDILLQSKNQLKQLSIARCNINNEAAERIASKLTYPNIASRTLLMLNLASNFIGDKGAKHFALALKTNRSLVYLNISDNLVTDDGAGAIFDALNEFSISQEELVQSRRRKYEYLKEKSKLTAKIISDMKSVDFDKKNLKKKNRKAGIIASGTSYFSKKSYDYDEDADACLQEKANAIVEQMQGRYMDPFSGEFIYSKNDEVYCKGNNILAYINLSYNNVSYITLKKIVSVLIYQKNMDRKPRGLIKVSIDGNCIPESCSELNEIDTVLDSYLTTCSRKNSLISLKKKA